MNTYSVSENWLLEGLKKGNEKAYSCLFEQYHRLLFIIAFRYLKSQEEAEDAVQYTLLRIWEQREIIDFNESLRSLLFTILKNYIFNELRHRQIVFEKNYLIAQNTPHAESDFIEEFEHKEMLQQLQKAVQMLPPQKRKICLLKMEGKLSNQEIADQLDLSLATVKSHYTQSIKQLRAILEKITIIFLFFS